MTVERLDEIIEKIDRYSRGVLSEQRYGHSARVASLSRDLCLRFGLEGRLGYLVGIAHDMCKSGKERWLLSLAAKDGDPICEIEAEKPSLLHGRAAAVLCASDFGVDDASALAAIRHHTFGSPDLDELGMILFVADKVEPGRVDYNPGLRKRILASDLGTMTRLVLEDNIRYLESRGKEVSMATLSMLEQLEGRITKK